MTEAATGTLWFRCVGGHVTSVQGATSDTPMWRCTCGEWASRDSYLNSLQSALTASEARERALMESLAEMVMEVREARWAIGGDPGSRRESEFAALFDRAHAALASSERASEEVADAL